jgi:putative oxidoreductase
MSFATTYAPTVLRVCLVVLFPFSGFDKIRNWPSAMRQASTMPFPQVLLALSVCVEFVTPVCIVARWYDRWAACVLAGFCVATAVLFHQFWRYADFWAFRAGEGLDHFWEFLKNFGLVGGLGFVVLLGPSLP